MAHTTFLLDVTRAQSGAHECVRTCLADPSPARDLVVLWSEAGGEALAEDLRAVDPRVSARRAGSGTGVCDWTAAVADARGELVVFLQPGDRLRGDAVARWQRALLGRDGAQWALAAAADAPYTDWWFQRDLAGSAATLLAAGAAFPDCTAAVAREAWMETIAAWPAVAADGTRATGWLALALRQAPALCPHVVADAITAPSAVDAERLASLLADLAARDPLRAGRLLADTSRVASGLRLAQDALLDAVDAAAACFGCAPGRRRDASEWRRRAQRLRTLVARGERPVWIWGAGQAGLEALAWLRARAVPVAGFVDRDPARTGQRWDGLEIAAPAALAFGAAATSPLVVVASMHHEAIGADLASRGAREGEHFVIFDADVTAEAGA